MVPIESLVNLPPNPSACGMIAVSLIGVDPLFEAEEDRRNHAQCHNPQKGEVLIARSAA